MCFYSDFIGPGNRPSVQLKGKLIAFILATQNPDGHQGNPEFLLPLETVSGDMFGSFELIPPLFSFSLFSLMTTFKYKGNTYFLYSLHAEKRKNFLEMCLLPFFFLAPYSLVFSFWALLNTHSEWLPNASKSFINFALNDHRLKWEHCRTSTKRKRRHMNFKLGLTMSWRIFPDMS